MFLNYNVRGCLRIRKYNYETNRQTHDLIAFTSPEGSANSNDLSRRFQMSHWPVLWGTFEYVKWPEWLGATFTYGWSLKASAAQSCLTLCDSMDCGPPGSSVHRFSRQEYWRGLPFPSPGDPPNPGIEPQVSCITGRFSTVWATREALRIY